MPTSLPPTLKAFRFLCWLGVSIWVGTVFYLSSRSSGELIEDMPWIMEAWDKALHFAAFFCGALPMVPALRLSTEWEWRRIFLSSVLWLSMYGALDEVHQKFTPSRSALDPGDWLADTLGSLAGALLAVFIHAKLERRNTTRPAPAGN